MMGDGKFGDGLTMEQRLARLEQRLGASVPAPTATGSILTSDTSLPGKTEWTGPPSYTAPTFAGTWANYGAGWRNAGYTKSADGMVHLTGLVGRSGTSGQTIFTLPAGYRPSATLLHLLQAVWSAATQNTRIDIASDGTVTHVSEPGVAIGYISLNNIPPFLAEA